MAGLCWHTEQKGGPKSQCEIQTASFMSIGFTNYATARILARPGDTS